MPHAHPVVGAPAWPMRLKPLPLLFALALSASPAYAVDIITNPLTEPGDTVAEGADGLFNPGGNGGAGGTGSYFFFADGSEPEPPVASGLTRGGRGGGGTGVGTSGGAGGASVTELQGYRLDGWGASKSVSLAALAIGGAGGQGWARADGGAGGSASGRAMTHNSGNSTLSSVVTGGAGGVSEGGAGGTGGAASSEVAAYSYSSGASASVYATAAGGDGGDSVPYQGSQPGEGAWGAGGAGGAASASASAVSTLYNGYLDAPEVRAVARGGNAGFGILWSNDGGAASATAVGPQLASAYAYGGNTRGLGGIGGAASAVASGQNAVAYAQGGEGGSSAGKASATAYGSDSAVATARGAQSDALAIAGRQGYGEAKAQALADAVGGPATASAQSRVEQPGTGIAAGASASNVNPNYYAYSESAANVEGSRYGAWAGADKPQAVAYAYASGYNFDGVGQGVQGGAYGNYDLHSDFSFFYGPDGTLQLTFYSPLAVGAGFEQLDLSISFNDSLVFQRSFTSVADAMLFFGAGTVTFGLTPSGFDRGVLSVDTRLLTDNGGFGFSFAGATSYNVPVTPVPEASSWLMLVLGLTVVAGMSRRKRPGLSPMASGATMPA